jgi:hypothetical protein
MDMGCPPAVLPAVIPTGDAQLERVQWKRPEIQKSVASQIAEIVENTLRPDGSAWGVSGPRGIETSSSPKLRKICMQRKNGRSRPRALQYPGGVRPIFPDCG